MSQYPQMHLLGEETREIDTDFGKAGASYDAPHDAPGSNEPYAGSESRVSLPPYEHRSPGLIHYPRSKETFYQPSGVNMPKTSLGFDCRAIVIQNVGANAFLYCPEMAKYLTVAATTYAAFNIPGGMQSLTLEWHTAVFNSITPAVQAGQFAVIELYDEWIPPAFLAASGGGAAPAAGSLIGTAVVRKTIDPTTWFVGANTLLSAVGGMVAIERLGLRVITTFTSGGAPTVNIRLSGGFNITTVPQALALMGASNKLGRSSAAVAFAFAGGAQAEPIGSVSGAAAGTNPAGTALVSSADANPAVEAVVAVALYTGGSLELVAVYTPLTAGATLV